MLNYPVKGGTFALYSLLRQHVNFKGNMPVPVTHLASDINLKFHSKKRILTSKLLKFLEQSTKWQAVITYIVLAGTCMVLGDGALTPAISGVHIISSLFWLGTYKECRIIVYIFVKLLASQQTKWNGSVHSDVYLTKF